MKTKITLLLLSILCCSVKNMSAFIVTLSASQTGTLCQYASVDFSANITDVNNYNKTAVWKVDGVTFYTSTPSISNAYFVYPNPGSYTHPFTTAGVHQVWCEVSSPAYNSGNPVYSDTLTYSVTQNEPPMVSILDVANGNPICRGTLDVFTATPIDAGTPTYTWYVDGVPEVSSTSATLNYIPLTAGVHFVYCEVHSSQACDALPPVNNPDAISNITIVNVDPCTGTGLYINGSVYFDANSNGALDSNEPRLNNRQVSLSPPATTLLTWNSGYYACAVDSFQSYQVTMNPPAGWQITSSPTTYNVAFTNIAVTGIDFGINSISPEPPDVSITITSQQPLCNSNRTFTLHCQNAGTMPASGTVQMVFDTLMTYVSATPAPDSILGNIIMWNYTNLLFSQPLNIYVTFLLPGPQNTIVNSATISALDSMANVIDTSGCSHSQLVLCSFDPNDKAVNPQNNNAQNYTLMNSWLDYTIRFQNTGNAPASVVEIIDTLSSLLDANSLQITTSSHSMITAVEGGNILHFRFLNINLPDSNANEPASHGYITYRIKPNAGLPDPSVINNTAYIYFDLNAPVQTNTTINTMTNSIISVQENSSHKGQSILLIPNPATSTITVQSPEFKVQNVEMYNTLGERVLQSEINSGTSGQTAIDIHTLPSGIYFVKVQAGEKIIVKKVVKM